jgi:hypothetical protein
VAYYLRKEGSSLILPSLENKYEAKFVVNPKEPKNWRLQGRKELLNRHERHAELRHKKEKEKEASQND